MAIQVARAVEYAEFALMGKASPAIGALRVVNIAGRAMFGLADWNWKRREPVSLALVAAQEYVSLPTDFGEVVALSVNNSIIQTFEWVSPQRLIDLRTNVLADLTGKYFGCISWPRVNDVSVAPNPARIEIAPTPSSNITEAMLLVYDAGWVDVNSDDDYIQIPSFMEPLFYEVIDAIALGMHFAREGTMGERLTRVKANDLYRSARRQDLNQQLTLGLMEGGQINEQGRWLTIGKPAVIGDPS
jgi:hypothetical protein